MPCKEEKIIIIKKKCTGAVLKFAFDLVAFLIKDEYPSDCQGLQFVHGYCGCVLKF